MSADGQNLVSVLHSLYTGSRQFKKDVNKAMRAAFGEDFEELLFPPDADQRIQLQIRWRSLQRERSAADISDGTLRFLFLLAVLANPSPAALIAIDEPETGLHPSMLPIVAEYAREAANKAQVILTTHSPEFLNAFGDDAPTTTVVERRDGETVLRIVSGDNPIVLAEGLYAGRTVPLERTGGHEMKFVLLVEGETEKQAAAAFLKRWLDPQLTQRVGIQVVNFNGWAELTRKLVTKAQKFLDGPDQADIIAVIGLLDLYGPDVLSEPRHLICRTATPGASSTFRSLLTGRDFGCSSRFTSSKPGCSASQRFSRLK